jgi:hypothetical protein
MTPLEIKANNEFKKLLVVLGNVMTVLRLILWFWGKLRS